MPQGLRDVRVNDPQRANHLSPRTNFGLKNSRVTALPKKQLLRGLPYVTAILPRHLSNNFHGLQKHVDPLFWVSDHLSQKPQGFRAEILKGFQLKYRSNQTALAENELQVSLPKGQNSCPHEPKVQAGAWLRLKKTPPTNLAEPDVLYLAPPRLPAFATRLSRLYCRLHPLCFFGGR